MTPDDVVDGIAIHRQLNQHMGQLLATLEFPSGRPVPHGTAITEIQKVMSSSPSDPRYVPLALAMMAPTKPWLDQVATRAGQLLAIAPDRMPPTLRASLAQLANAIETGNGVDALETVVELDSRPTPRLPRDASQAYKRLRDLTRDPSITAMRLLFEYVHGERAGEPGRSYVPAERAQRASDIAEQHTTRGPFPAAVPGLRARGSVPSRPAPSTRPPRR
ncbi:hypothetical protein [Cryptosporangium sp. NPDC051539]|uniref:hypothetical protein n=1 Tax=Cryptosporangium sp. NPDC051539 TaxID=3363962 RepID=UPI003793A43C